MGQGFMPSQMPEAVRAIPNIVWLDVDPSVVATIGKMGQIACNYLTGTFYKKTDDGISINWQLITLGATPTGDPNRVAYFNALGVLSYEQHFRYFESLNTCLLGSGITMPGLPSNCMAIGSNHTLNGGTNCLLVGAGNSTSTTNPNFTSFLLGDAIWVEGTLGAVLAMGGGDGVSPTIPTGLDVGRSILIATVGSAIAGPGAIIADSIANITGSTFSNLNQYCLLFGNGASYDGCNYLVTIGGGGTFVSASRCLSVGHFNNINTFNTVSLLGEFLTATRNHQVLCGSSYAAEAETLFAVGIGGTRLFQVRDDGRVDMNIGGRRDKSRLAPLAVESVDANTDYIVLLNNGAAQTVNLPSGVDGMTYFIKDASGVAGHTINANGADVFEGGAAALVMGAPYRSYQLHFQTGVWYILSIS